MEVEKVSGLRAMQIVGQRFWVWSWWVVVSLSSSIAWGSGCTAVPILETYRACTDAKMLNCTYSTVVKGWSIISCPPIQQSPPSPPPPQAQAPQPVAPISASKECLLLEAQIEHNYLQCVTDAKKKYADNSALCPPSTSNSVEGGVNGPISGSASNTISPNGTCVSGHARTQGADMAQCASNRSALNINYVNQCK